MNMNLIIQQKINSKRINKVLEVAHYIFLDEIDNFKFNKISKYSRSKEIYKKISHDFKTVNRFIYEKDYFNAATILRALYENIMYVIVTSYNLDIIITAETRTKEINKKLKDNHEKIFTGDFENEDFDEMYEYLSKMIHPSAVKEFVADIVKNQTCRMYFLNNLKYMMVTIEFIYLDYLNKKIGNKESELNLDLIGLCSYVNMINGKLFSDNMKDDYKKVQKYMTHQDDIKYIEKRELKNQKFMENIKMDTATFQEIIDAIKVRVDNAINNSKYRESVTAILKGD